MKNSFWILIVSLLFIGCSVKIPNTWEQRVVKSPLADETLHVDVTGKGPALLMLHGFGMNHHSFDALVGPLSRKYRVYNIDLKGFGNSPKPADARYSPYDQAVLVLKYIKKQDLHDVTIIGHSYGGSTALCLALMDPSKIKKMALIAPAAYKQTLPSMIKQMQIPLFGMLGLYLLPASYEVRSSYQYAFYDDHKISQKTLENLTQNLKENGSKSALYRASFDLIPEDIETVSKRYREIHTPTLILWGEKDIVIPKGFGYRLERVMPHATLKIIENAGHIPHEESPEKTLKYLLDFL